MNLRAIAQALGGDVTNHRAGQISCPGPGHSKQDRSLSVRFTAPDQFVVNSFAGDDPIVCKDYVRQRLGLPDWQPGDEQNRTIHPSRVEAWDRMVIERETNERRPMTEDEMRNRDLAVQMWNEAQDPRGTLAERYLREHRKLDLPGELAGRVLRFHPACARRNEDTGRFDPLPMLIVPFRSIDTDDITAIHRIALNTDGSKIDRRMLGPVRRAAIKLDDIAGDTLCSGEGIETCLAARELGYAPAWALGSVGALSFFPVLDGIKRLRIFGEHCEASRKAIRKFCGRRWRQANRTVTVIMPDIGADLNDELIAKRISR
jgi:putative DNA primase/helicase